MAVTQTAAIHRGTTTFVCASAQKRAKLEKRRKRCKHQSSIKKPGRLDVVKLKCHPVVVGVGLFLDSDV